MTTDSCGRMICHDCGNLIEEGYSPLTVPFPGEGYTATFCGNCELQYIEVDE